MGSKHKYVLAFDQGTTSSRAILFDSEGREVAVAQREFRQIFPASGFVEHDPQEIWSSQSLTAVEVLEKAGITEDQISGVGITNQRETTVVWNRFTGEPVCNAIVWQDRRTSAFCDRIRKTHGELIRRRTGLETDAYFSASKLRWILRNVENAGDLANKGDLCFGTIDTWLLWKLTGGKAHITDVSNASRTMLFDINQLKWDPELLELFEIPASVLPEVKTSSEIYGEISTIPELKGVPIGGIAGDQQAALFGQLCTTPGDTKNTYGTGCFMLQNTGNEIAVSKHHLLTTVGWQIGETTSYALEGSVFIGGAVVQWLRDSLGIIDDSVDVEALSNTVDDNGGVYFVPAFAGLGTPYWNQNARGLIIGLTRGTGKAHIARAALESIAFQTAELLESVQNDSGKRLSELRVDGGASRNRSLLQFQADILGIPIVAAESAETTALGAAYLAGLATGFWKNIESLENHGKAASRVEPSMPESRAQELKDRWKKAVTRSLDWN